MIMRLVSFSRLALVIFGVLLAVITLGAHCAGAEAAFGINGFDVRLENEDGSPATRAGSHPSQLTAVFHVNSHIAGPGEPFVGEAVADQELKTLGIDLPVGVTGDPSATPRCSHADFLAARGEEGERTGLPKCSDDTAVGVALPEWNSINEGATAFEAVYNLNPPPGVVAELGFRVDQAVVTIDVGVEDSPPYRVSSLTTNVSQLVRFTGAEVRLWGDPSSAVHDSERGTCMSTPAADSCPYDAGVHRPFLTLPRACPSGPLAASYSATSWQDPAAPPVEGTSATPLNITDCEGLAFAPEVSSMPSSTSAESPSGLSFDLDVSDPSLTELGGVADADLKKAVVTLPQGITTNPAVAAGLLGCTQAQFGSETIDSAPGTGCPEASRIGTVEVESPLLTEEDGAPQILPGSIYIAAQHDNQFDNLLTVDMVIKDPALGILIRSAGRVEPDPATGQLTTTFDELPQLPFSHFRLHFREGMRAPLITPPACGTYTTTAQLHSYARPDVPLERQASFQVSSGAGGGGCPQSVGQLPNSPFFSAGSTFRQAGAYSPFVLNLSRPDGSQQLSQIKTTLPGGLLGKLAGITYCPESGIAQAATRSGEGEGATEIAQPSCPAASRVGAVTVGAGAGSEPLQVTGTAYLAGPYKGAPLSLEIITPAIAGPFDLGVVAVRTALRVDPLTAQITAESDPIPTILHGLPLDLRSISIEMNRPNFTLNPTSCEPKSITASATSTLGSVAPLSQYFQVSDCAVLAFKPRLKLSLKGQTRRAGHPALKAVLTYPKGSGYANIRRAQVNLPHSEFLDQGNIGRACTKPVLLEGKCPAKSVYGKAKAWTPLLDTPLEGPVYLVGGFGYKLPALVAELNGQIRILLVGKVDSGKNKGIRNTFEAVPDAPVEKFVLEMKGGKKYSLLENSEDLCRKPQRAIARFTAQNGNIVQEKPLIGVKCRQSTKSGAKHRGASSHRGGGTRR
jgi:hypothetical protein